MNKIILAIGILTLLTITGCATENIAEQCNDVGGNWIDDYNECEQISMDQCDKLGGSFDDCASACRHDPEAEVCMQVCVPVCTVN